MLIETLNALNQAGIQALESICQTPVQAREVSLVREGRMKLPHLVTLRIKGSSLQMVHLGCDEKLAAKLAELSTGQGGRSGLDILADSFLGHLLEKFEDRNPRGTLENPQSSPITLHTRGVRTFQFRLETGQGQMFYLAEVPSRAEMALVKGSDFMASMEAIYLPGDWHGDKELTGSENVDNFMTFLRKTETDIYLETPAGDGTATLNSGMLVEVCPVDDRPILKLITDFSDPTLGVPAAGSTVKACAGIDDRSLEFVLTYEGPSEHELVPGTSLPCALFSIPAAVSIGQRRRTFRVPVSASVNVELSAADGTPDPETVKGRLADLSFSGARILAEQSPSGPSLNKDGRVICLLHFPDTENTLRVEGVIRRFIAGPADTEEWADEFGIEFLVSPGGDRAGLDYIRQFVLELQRAKLAQRLQVTSS